MVEVVLGSGGELAHSADRAADGTVPGLVQPRLDGVLDRVGELESMGVEELDAVVGHSVVRRRQHHPEARPVTLGEIRDRRSGQDAGEEHIDSRARQSRDDRRLEELATRPGIAPHDSARARAVGHQSAGIAEHVGRRSGEGQREFGGEVAVGESPHAVGAEEATAHGAPISACCTEAPCGPS